MNDSKFPGGFWHCQVELKDNKRIGIINDMSFEVLTENVLRPWQEGRPFAVGGLLVHERRDILQIRLQCTKESNVRYTDIYEAGLRRSNAASARNRANLAFEYGQDFTQELLFAPPASSATSTAETSSDQELALLLRICRRISLSARQLTDRRKDKPDFVIEDEYDVQDLLKCILKAHLNHHIREEPIGQVAGFSSKADFAIEALGTIVEVKYARIASDQRKLTDELAADCQYYAKWPHLKVLIYLVYNTAAFKEPDLLETLSGSRSVNGKEFMVHVLAV